MRIPRTQVSTSRRLSICALATAYAAFVAAISWDLVRAEGAGWNDRIVLLQHFERGEYDHLYEGAWTAFIQNQSLWYRAVDDCASLLGGIQSTLTLLSFGVSAIYAASVLGTSFWLLPLLFVPMQIDLFDAQIRSACAGALLIAAFNSNRVTISILLALISMCLHSVAALLIGLWVVAAVIDIKFRESPASGVWALIAASIITCGVIACLLFTSQAVNKYSTETYSSSVTVFCGAMFVLGAVATGRKRLDRQALLSLMVLLIVGAGSPLGLGVQRLLPLTMPVAAAAFLRFRDPYPMIAGALCLVAHTYWTVKWIGW